MGLGDQVPEAVDHAHEPIEVGDRVLLDVQPEATMKPAAYTGRITSLEWDIYGEDDPRGPWNTIFMDVEFEDGTHDKAVQGLYCPDDHVVEFTEYKKLPAAEENAGPGGQLGYRNHIEDALKGVE